MQIFKDMYANLSLKVPLLVLSILNSTWKVAFPLFRFLNISPLLKFSKVWYQSKVYYFFSSTEFLPFFKVELITPNVEGRFWPKYLPLLQRQDQKEQNE